MVGYGRDLADDLTRRAAEMLLQGATLLSQPCPYCNGVRVVKDGHALCASCGKEPQKRDVPRQGASKEQLREALEKKLQKLTADLAQEKDHARQQEILRSVNSLLEALEKINPS